MSSPFEAKKKSLIRFQQKIRADAEYELSLLAIQQQVLERKIKSIDEEINTLEKVVDEKELDEYINKELKKMQGFGIGIRLNGLKVEKKESSDSDSDETDPN